MKRLLLLTPLALLLAACGGAGSSAPRASQAQATTHPRTTPTATATTPQTAPIPSAPAGGTTTASASDNAPAPLAAADLQTAVDQLRDAKSLRFQFLLGQLSGDKRFWVQATGAETAGPPAKLSLDLRLTGSRRLHVTEVRDGDTLYLTSKKVAASLPTGKKWMSVSLSRSAAFLSGLDQADPRLYGQLLRYASGPFDAAGTATVDGVATKVYLGSISLRRIAISYDRDSVVRRLYSSSSLLALRKVGIDLVPAKVWIDQDGLLRRFRLTMAQSGVDLVIDGRLTGYGQPVPATLPPAAQVSAAP